MSSEEEVLAQKGSFLPHLRFMLNAVVANERSEPENAYTAAPLSLSLICGAQDFSLVLGGAIDPPNQGRLISAQRACGNLTLNDRVGSCRHFISAAALQAANNRGFAV